MPATSAVQRSDRQSGAIDYDQWKSWGLKLLLFGLCFGIFALRFPLIVLVSLGASAIIFASLSCVRPIHAISICVLLNYAYWLASGLLSRGVTMASFASGDFWRGEGRCFFFYLPLLALSIMHIRQRDLEFLVKLVIVLTLFGAVLGVLWLAGLGDLFQTHEEESGEHVDSIYFIGLLTSHTGAGAFWATVGAFMAGYAWSRRKRSLQFVALLAILLIVGTGGRAATLGIIGALGWLLVRGEILEKRTMLVGSLTLVLIGAGAVYVGSLVPEISERMSEMLSAEAFESITAMIEEEPLDDPKSYFFDGTDLPHHNLVIRVFLWKYALNLFTKSPLTGVGFARFNDTDLDLIGIPHVAQLAIRGERYYGSGIRWESEQKMTSTGNAHNSYLHILAETGLIGLVLFFVLWLKMFASVEPGPQTSPDDFVRAYAVGCQAMIICLAIGALAGHALGAPSGGILLTTMIGAWIAFKDNDKALPESS